MAASDELIPGRDSLRRRRVEEDHSLTVRVRGRVYRSLLRALPYTRTVDRVVSLVEFVRYHKRLPTRSRWYNDEFYRMKTRDDILDPLRVFVTDKEFMKLYVKAVVGEQYAVPTLAVLESVDDIDEYEFPDQCCIKATHTSGHVILRENGEPVDRDRVKRWLSVNYYLEHREANYKLLRPKVIVEPLLFGSSNVGDFKVFCVRGRPKLIQVDVDRFVDHQRQFFDVDWNEQAFSILYPRTARTIPRPENLDEMLAVASRLSERFWFVRVDMYSDGKRSLRRRAYALPRQCTGGIPSGPPGTRGVERSIRRRVAQPC